MLSVCDTNLCRVTGNGILMTKKAFAFEQLYTFTTFIYDSSLGFLKQQIFTYDRLDRFEEYKQQVGQYWSSSKSGG